MRFLALLFLLAFVVPAEADPSFDCENASTVIEKTICSDQNPGLAMRDGAMARLYEALKGEQGHGAVLATQSDWLASRDQCGADPECLAHPRLKARDDATALLVRVTRA